MSSVIKIELLTEGPYSVGTRWRETRKMFGKEETQEMWVVEAVANRRTIIRAEDGGAIYETAFRLSPIASRTEVEVNFSASTPNANLVQKATWFVFGPIGAQLTKRMLKSMLAEIAAAAEK